MHIFRTLSLTTPCPESSKPTNGGHSNVLSLIVSPKAEDATKKAMSGKTPINKRFIAAPYRIVENPAPVMSASFITVISVLQFIVSTRSPVFLSPKYLAENEFMSEITSSGAARKASI